MNCLSNVRLIDRTEKGERMKSSEMFEVCHARYRLLRNQLKDDAGQVQSLELDKPARGYFWRPPRARACEYVADFERIGRHALRRQEWKGRLKLFEIFFLQGTEYRRAISLVGVAEGTFDYWFQQVKRTVGAEFSRTGLFPPSQYFRVQNRRSCGGKSETVLAERNQPGAFARERGAREMAVSAAA